jgi:hypothetical protein
MINSERNHEAAELDDEYQNAQREQTLSITEHHVDSELAAILQQSSATGALRLVRKKAPNLPSNPQ